MVIKVVTTLECFYQIVIVNYCSKSVLSDRTTWLFIFSITNQATTFQESIRRWFYLWLAGKLTTSFIHQSSAVQQKRPFLPINSVINSLLYDDSVTSCCTTQARSISTQLSTSVIILFIRSKFRSTTTPQEEIVMKEVATKISKY